MASILEKFMNRSIGKSVIDQAFIKNIDLGLSDVVELEPYSKSSIVYTCVSTTQRAISQCPLRVYDEIGNGDWEVSINDPTQQLLKRPNSYMDSYSFVESICGYLLLDGDVFILPYPPGGAKYDSLWVIPKKHITPKLDEKTNQLMYWEYSTGNEGGGKAKKVINLWPEELCRVFFWNPYKQFEGFSPLTAGKISISTDFKASKYNQAFFDNGAVPGGILTTTQSLSPDIRKRIKEEFETKHQGFNRAHRLAVLEGGLTYSQTGLTQKDMDYPELKKLTREEILQCFGMKKSIISITEQMNYLTAKNERREWWKGTNVPIMKLIASALTFGLMGEDNLKKKIDFDISNVEALREDIKEVADIAKIFHQMGFTANEINDRFRLGFKHKPWRDYTFIAPGVIPVGPGIPVTEVPQLEGNGSSEEEPPLLEAPVEEDMYKFNSDLENKIEKEWRNLAEDLNKLELAFVKKTTRTFLEMRKKAIALYKRDGIETLKTEKFFEEKANISKYTAKLYRDSIEAGIESLERQLGYEINFGATSPEAIEFIREKSLHIRDIPETVSRQIKISIMQDTLDLDNLKFIFNKAYGRARTIARTEIWGTMNFARYEGMRIVSALQRKHKMWFTAQDERVRGNKPSDKANHVVMHGKIIRMNEKWKTNLSILEYPGDPKGHPSDVINCRCWEILLD